ncbi:5040_t:CDS:2 [Funneliformis geosporum]|nr:5040_t:CDS:2 [Funneliformis geosporum]
MAFNSSNNNSIQMRSYHSTVQPKEQLLAVLSASTKCASSSTASTSEYRNVLKKNAFTISNPSIQDMTPEAAEFFLTPDFLVRDNGGNFTTMGGSKNRGPIKKNRKSFVEHFRGGNVEKNLTIISAHDKYECIWEGFVMDGTLFLQGNAMENFNFKKDSIVAVIELAEECLKCHSLIICVERQTSFLAALMRIFLYIGFELVAPGIFNHPNDYLLVGMEF